MKNHWLTRGLVTGLIMCVVVGAALVLYGMIAVALGPSVLGLSKVIANALAIGIIIVLLAVASSYLDKGYRRDRHRKSDTANQGASGAGAQEPS